MRAAGAKEGKGLGVLDVTRTTLPRQIYRSVCCGCFCINSIFLVLGRE